MNSSIVVGRNMVLVKDDEFGNGFQTGYLRFKMDFEGVPLSDNGIYELLCQSTQDVQNMSRYNAGYVTGWMAGLFERRSDSEVYATDQTELHVFVAHQI